jgi:hypothetical protein
MEVLLWKKSKTTGLMKKATVGQLSNLKKKKQKA